PIAPTEIDSRRSGEVQGEPRDEQIIVSLHGALHCSPWRGRVFSHLEACLCCALEEVMLNPHLERARTRDRAETLGEGDSLAKPMTAVVAHHEMLLDGFFSRGR